MVTYQQLESEPYWGLEMSTPEAQWLSTALRAHFGVGPDAMGQKGDNRHLNGGHRSQQWILKSKYCNNRHYTVEAGLIAEELNYLSAFDLTPRDNATMLLISQRIDKATRAGELEEVVEWFGNTNNDTRVDGWDNIRNAVASSESSHLWHLHFRLGRKLLRRMDVMRKIYAVLTGTTVTAAPTPQEDDVSYNYVRYEGDPTGAIFITDFGGTSMWVQSQNDKDDFDTLADEGRLTMKSKTVRVVGNDRLIGQIIGKVPSWWLANRPENNLPVHVGPVPVHEPE